LTLSTSYRCRRPGPSPRNELQLLRAGHSAPPKRSASRRPAGPSSPSRSRHRRRDCARRHAHGCHRHRPITLMRDRGNPRRHLDPRSLTSPPSGPIRRLRIFPRGIRAAAALPARAACARRHARYYHSCAARRRHGGGPTHKSAVHAVGPASISLWARSQSPSLSVGSLIGRQVLYQVPGVPLPSPVPCLIPELRRYSRGTPWRAVRAESPV
jgi:hypothetical protein